MTRWIVRPLRRITQVLALLVLVLLPIFALYTHYKEARAIDDLPADEWRGRVVRSIDDAVGDSPARAELVATSHGTIWSARLGGISLTDPLAGAEAIVSSRWFYGPLLWSLLIPVAVTVLLGRVFCGWICPMNTLLEIVDKCRGLLRLAEIRPRDVKFSLRTKYLMLALALGFVAATGVPLLAMVYPPAVLSREVHLWVFGSALGLGLYLILGIVALELFVSRRWWCRYVCPGGALYSLLGRFRLVRVRRDEQKCVRCGDCVRACQFDLRPMLVATTGMECTNCASCISGCDSKALSYRFVLPLPLRGARPPGGEAARNGSKTKDEPAAANGRPANGAAQAARTLGLLMALAVPVVLGLPGTAAAHHILGLPHYSYKENYPQVPTLEYPAQTGPYDVLMTSYPGKPTPGEAATLAFYIKDRNTGQPYGRPVTVRVLQTSTFGDNRVIHPPATHQPFDNEHKYTVTYPEDGEYVVELTMDVEGRQEVIPFLMVAGEPSAAASVLIAVVAGLVVFLVVVRAIKVKRDRRRRRQASEEAATVSPVVA